MRLTLCLTLLICFTWLASAQMFVSPTGDNTTGNSWATAYTSIEAAAAASGPTTEFWVREGTYDVTNGFSLRSGSTMYGGFPATGNPGMDERDPELYPTVLDGGDTAGNLIVLDSVVNITLDGIQFTGAIGAGEGIEKGGAVVLLDTSGILISDCVFFNNVLSAGEYGGGLSVVNPASGGKQAPTATVTLERCTFQQNSAEDGGAICTWRAVILAYDCRFFDNTATNNGGAICIENDSWQDGGGVYISRTLFSGNSALKGGAVYGANGGTDLTNCILESNTASDSGGAVYHYADILSASMYNCTVVDNTATNYGDAVYSYFSPTYVVNSIFSGNGEHCVYLPDVLSECYFANCLFVPGVQKVLDSPFVTIDTAADYNALVEDFTSIDADAGFTDAAQGDYTLTSGSACIDAAAGMIMMGHHNDDFLGNARGVNGTDEPRGDGSDWDIGAFEYIPPPAPPEDPEEPEDPEDPGSGNNSTTGMQCSGPTKTRNAGSPIPLVLGMTAAWGAAWAWSRRRKLK